MFKFSNIVILVGVIFFHYGILQLLLISPPDQAVRQDLATAGTILEISLIPEMRMESASRATSVVKEEEEIEETEEKKIPKVEKRVVEPEIVSSPTLEDEPSLITIEESEKSVRSHKKAPVLPDRSRKEKKSAKTSPKTTTDTQNLAEGQKKAEISKSNNNNSKSKNRGSNPQENRSNNRNPGGSDLKNQAFVPPSHQGSALGNRKPRYPELSLRRREEGQVTLLATVLPSGRAKMVKVHKSSGYPRLDEAALKAAREYRYQPAQKEGKAIEYDYLFTVTFKIEKR